MKLIPTALYLGDNASPPELSAVRVDPQAEALLRDMRRLLGYAVRVSPIDLETADAFVARAANKLSAAIRLQERES